KRIMDRFRHFPLEQHQEYLAELQKQAKAVEHQANIKQSLYDTAYYHQELEQIKANRQSFHANSQAYLDQYYQQIALSWRVDQKARLDQTELEAYKHQYCDIQSQIIDKWHYIVHAIKPEYNIGFANNKNI